MLHYVGSHSYLPRLRFPSFGVITCCSSEQQVSQFVSRRKVLEKVDEELAKGDDKSALFLVKDLQGKPGGLRCFGTARQVGLLFSSFTIFFL